METRQEEGVAPTPYHLLGIRGKLDLDGELKPGRRLAPAVPDKEIETEGGGRYVSVWDDVARRTIHMDVRTGNTLVDRVRWAPRWTDEGTLPQIPGTSSYQQNTEQPP